MATQKGTQPLSLDKFPVNCLSWRFHATSYTQILPSLLNSKPHSSEKTFWVLCAAHHFSRSMLDFRCRRICNSSSVKIRRNFPIDMVCVEKELNSQWSYLHVAKRLFPGFSSNKTFCWFRCFLDVHIVFSTRGNLSYSRCCRNVELCWDLLGQDVSKSIRLKIFVSF